MSMRIAAAPSVSLALMREARSVFAGIGFAEEIQYAEITRLQPLRPGLVSDRVRAHRRLQGP